MQRRPHHGSGLSQDEAEQALLRTLLNKWGVPSVSATDDITVSEPPRFTLIDGRVLVGSLTHPPMGRPSEEAGRPVIEPAAWENADLGRLSERITAPLDIVIERRMVQAVNGLVHGASEAAKSEAAAAPSDIGMLIRLMADATVEPSPVASLDPLAGALARAAGIKSDLLGRAGTMLSGEEIGRILGISRQAVDQRRRKGLLLALRQGSDWSYPAFQVATGQVLPGLDAVIAALDDPSGWSVLEMLLLPHDQLGGRTPLEILAAGTGPDAAFDRLLAQYKGDGFA